MAKKEHSGLSRRDFMKRAGTGAALAAGTGIGLFGGKAPALAQKRSLHVLQWSSFKPAMDVEYRAMAEEYGKAHGVDIRVEFINLNDVLTRAIAAIESGTGPDVILLQWNQAYLFGDKLADVGDVVAQVGGEELHEFNRLAVKVDGVYRGVPCYNIGSAMVYNKSMWQEVGIDTYPDTYDELLKSGKQLKDAGYPIGWTLGHTIGDGAFGNYPLVWAFGGREVDERGKVAINSKETRTALEYMREFWSAACDEGGMAWNDSSNNQAFLGQTISGCLNAASIYQKAKNDGNPLYKQIEHTPAPKGPGGRYHLIQQSAYHVPAYTKNRQLGKEYLTWLLSDKQYERVFVAGEGFAQGNHPKWYNHPMWDKDPIMKPYRELGKTGRTMGYAGPYSRAASEVQAKYIVVDMLARSIQEGVEPAVKWAENELKQVYEA